MTTKKRLAFGLGVVTALGLGTVLGGCSVFGIRAGTEEAAYTTLRENGDFEVRQYENALIARTVTEGDYDAAGRAAFRRLGGYIFGDNRSRESIAMTAPVLQEVDEEGEAIAMTAPVLQERDGERWVQTFVLPRGYMLDTLPVPTDPNVEILEMPGAKVAVVRYSGFISSESIAEQTERLSEWIDAAGLRATSGARSAGYDPPWTIPFLRRNEVQIEIE